MNTHKLLINGRNLEYLDSGDGPTVVLLHGFGGDASVWESTVAALSGYRCIRPHLPGTVGSESLDSTSIETLANSVMELLDALGVGRFALLGHSMGGYIALAMAEGWAGRLTGLGLVHSTAYADTDEKRGTRQKGIRFIKQHGGAEFLRSTIPGLYAPAHREGMKSIIESHITQAANNANDASLIDYYEAMMRRPDRTGVVKNAPYPLLWILGRHDAAVPIADGLAQCHLAHQSHLCILEESGHMGMYEQPEQFTNPIRVFLRNLSY